MDAYMLSVILGAETGLLKDVTFGDKSSWRNINSIREADKRKEITCMCWGSDDQANVAMGLRNQTVCIYNTEKTSDPDVYSFNGGEGPFRGIAKYENKFITCVQSGLLQVWDNGDSKLQFSCGENISRMRQDPDNRHIIATGGEENDLKIWDLNRHREPVFKAKNVRNDFLNLRVPVWVTDVSFLPGGDRVVTSTGHHQVRMYDTRYSQRRPVMDMEFDEYRITAMSLSSNNNEVIVGNTHGNMGLIDVRKAGRLVRTFKGFAGGIRSIQCHTSLPIVASCGLDRFLHVHNVNTKQPIQKIYLKSRLNCLLMRDHYSEVTTPDIIGQDSVESIQENSDELWDNMELVGDKYKAKKNIATKQETDTGTSNDKVVVKKGKKRKSIQLRNVFYEGSNEDVASEEMEGSKVKTKKKKKGQKTKG